MQLGQVFVTPAHRAQLPFIAPVVGVTLGRQLVGNTLGFVVQFGQSRFLLQLLFKLGHNLHAFTNLSIS